MGQYLEYDLAPWEWSMIIDVPSEKDYEYEVLFWSIEPVKRMRVPKITIFNQWLDSKTKMACGIYWMTHIVNAQNKISDAVNKIKNIELKPDIIWKEKVLPANPQAEFVWTTLQSNLELFRKLNLITWYAKANKKEEIMDALDHQRYIYTGSQTWNWQAVRENKIYELRTDGKIVGHITARFTYDKDYVFGVNSYWPTNWPFKCPWDIFLNNFFNKYACSDTRDESAFEKFREVYSK